MFVNKKNLGEEECRAMISNLKKKNGENKKIEEMRPVRTKNQIENKDISFFIGKNNFYDLILDNPAKMREMFDTCRGEIGKGYYKQVMRETLTNPSSQYEMIYTLEKKEGKMKANSFSFIDFPEDNNSAHISLICSNPGWGTSTLRTSERLGRRMNKQVMKLDAISSAKGFYIDKMNYKTSSESEESSSHGGDDDCTPLVKGINETFEDLGSVIRSIQ